jgi:hypothetical protein
MIGVVVIFIWGPSLALQMRLWDALRLVAGLRFKRENATAWAASELALGDPMLLAAK